MKNKKDNTTLLQIKDLKIEGFSDERWHKIIKGVNLELKRGEVLGLIGESGAGKSTLGLAAMGYTQPGCRITGGQINFDGVDLTKRTDSEKRKYWGNRMTYVAQSAAASFNPAHRLINQTTESTIRAGLKKQNEAFDEARALYDALNLPNPETIGERYPHQVSGGQLQRIMTAMAMSPNPDLIVFDEPTTALDVTTQVEVLAAMRDIVKTYGTAAIYITHDLSVVAQMADRIKVLRYGEEVEEAMTRKMLKSPKEDYTKSLWSVRSIQKPEKKNPKKKKKVKKWRTSAHRHTYACFTACGGAAKCRNRQDCDVSVRIFGDVENAENLNFGAQFTKTLPRHRHRDQQTDKERIMQQSRQSKQQVGQPACQPGRQQPS